MYISGGSQPPVYNEDVIFVVLFRIPKSSTQNNIIVYSTLNVLLSWNVDTLLGNKGEISVYITADAR
jgi:hypothetical protein